MPFDVKDPRAGLGSMKVSGVGAYDYATAEYGKFYETEPDETASEANTWYFRGQNFVVAYTEGLAGAEFSRGEQPDEYVLLLPDQAVSVEIATKEGTEKVGGYSISFLPPGKTSIRLLAGGRFIRLFTVRSEDLVKRCANVKSYDRAHPNVALLENWPEPVGGCRLHTYSMDVPREEGRFGRIWRCSTFMVNYFYYQVGPRDATKMSPHSHDDFEQCSLVLEGEYTHHVRYPWGINMNNWQDDEHEYCGAPSVAVLPPPAIHTTRAIGEANNQLVDIFCPPRIDFSEKPGWVLNAEDYPMPTKK